MSVQNQGLPPVGLPIVDPMTGILTPAWFQFMASLWQRTGGGNQLGNVQSVSAEGLGGIIASVTNPTTTPNIRLNFNINEITTFTPNSKGVVPASGGGTTNYLRADGTWTALAGTGTVTTVSVTTANGVSGTVSNPTTTPGISISLGAITPSSVASSGAVSGTTGTFSSTMRFGSYTATPITNTGYITINDAGGTPRRLMVG